MTTSNFDRIEKKITLKASPARVWRALTDHVEFSEWFGVSLEGPILMGEEFRGQITHPGCEHMTLRAWVERMDSEQCFAFRWHPHADAPGFDHASEPTTLVEFVLEPRDGGTHLSICESGFDELREEHRSECFKRNEGGWTLQVESLTAHVDGAGLMRGE